MTMFLKLSVVGFVALVVGGCFSHSSAKDRHANFYGCPSAEVTTQDVEAQGHAQVRTVGCGHEDLFYCIGAKCRSPKILALKLFSADEACPVEQSAATEQGQGTWAVTGCGKTKKYRCVEVANEVIHCDPVS
jgi:hypothetical protein